MLPFLGSDDDAKAYHAFDVVVTARNPLLAALVLHHAVKSGATAAVMLSEGADPWPYDLADTAEMAAVITSSVGISDEAHPTGGSSTSWALERLLAGIPRSVPTIQGCLAPASRHPSDEIALYMTGRTVSSSDRNIHPRLALYEQSHMQDMFLRFMAGRPTACVGKGRTVVFARQIVLTGRPEIFGRSVLTNGLLDWGHDRIRPLGTARWSVQGHEAEAKLMLEDILLATR